MKSRQSSYILARKRACSNYRSEALDHQPAFGKYIFSPQVMEKSLPKAVFHNIIKAMKGEEKLKVENADVIAHALKEWAVELGATHFTHWFCPLTGASAEKHDAFLTRNESGTCIAKFDGSQLIQGEPDASSFPSGGLRTTFEARGYTGWDPSTPPFIWKSGGGAILCIPSVFYSWTGDALDVKIPLLRSDVKINHAVKRLLSLLKIPANHVYSTLGAEQEYFVIDDALYSLRPDLMTLGSTVFGAPPPKGQELEDHYFTSVKDRILSYMSHVENAAVELGIPLKTRHNEVAPAQHEMAPVFDRAAISCDQNMLLMELLVQIAKQHGLACLLTEKPFKGINGSGKHNNWSLMTDTGLNLLDPADNVENGLSFLTILTAILYGVHKHAELLRASIASYGNEHRLGGDEAPPVIMSVYLGEALEKFLESIETGETAVHIPKQNQDLKIPIIPELPKHSSDRNRTSPFAFTGNKFEFRAVGSSENCSWPITVINVIVADSLNAIMDEIETHLAGNKPDLKELVSVFLSVLRKYLQASKAIRFAGDNYSQEWEKEAEKRKLSHIKSTIDALEVLKTPSTQKLFEEVLSNRELESRYEIFLDKYSKQVNIQVNLMLDMFTTHILPAAMAYQKSLAETILLINQIKINETEEQQHLLNTLTVKINEAIKKSHELKSLRNQALEQQSPVKTAQYFSKKVIEASKCFRQLIDELEQLVDDELWPFPKYRELLYSV